MVILPRHMVPAPHHLGTSQTAKTKGPGWDRSRWAGESSQDSLLKDGLRAAPRQEGPRGVGWELHVESRSWQGHPSVVPGGH